VTSFVDAHADRVRFHAWLQWLLDEQLQRAGATVGVVTDLAIGTDPGGADAWMWQDSLALGVRVGAPPDEFNVAGQDWGFPPFDPWRVRVARFEPFVEVVRAALAHAGGVRIDHVAGLFRLYWIPPGMESDRGLYVRYPWEELLAILALESVRAGAWVVGEDLGTVEPRVREELARRNVLSTRVMWFEDEPPARYPERSLAVVTTHDLPTVAGAWTGADVSDQRECGVEPDPTAAAAMRDRLQGLTGLADDAPVSEVVTRTYARLAEAPSAVVLAGLEDALVVPWRPNLPGTVDERPNWCRALPQPLEALVEDPLALQVADILRPGRDAPTDEPGPGRD
jgi:4-alpha-glucanotransferase